MWCGALFSCLIQDLDRSLTFLLNSKVLIGALFFCLILGVEKSFIFLLNSGYGEELYFPA